MNALPSYCALSGVLCLRSWRVAVHVFCLPLPVCSSGAMTSTVSVRRLGLRAGDVFPMCKQWFDAVRSKIDVARSKIEVFARATNNICETRTIGPCWWPISDRIMGLDLDGVLKGLEE